MYNTYTMYNPLNISWHVLNDTMYLCYYHILGLNGVFGATKPAKVVETHWDWVIAWTTIYKAMCFIFPHCEGELDEYNYITPYFASIYLCTHTKVLNLNQAIRKYVGSVNDISLNKLSKFCYLQTCHLQGNGTGKISASAKERAKQ